MKIAVLICSHLLLTGHLAGATPKVCTQFNTAVVKGTPAAKLKKLMEAMWNFEMIEDPESATFMGFPGQNDRLSDLSLEAIARHDQATACQLAALKKINPGSLRGEDVVTFDLAKRDLEASLEGQKFGRQYLVLSHLGGIHLGIVNLIKDSPKENQTDYSNIITRLKKFPLQIQQTEVLLREGLKHKITPVKMFLARVPGQFDRVLTPKPEDSPLYAQFKEIPPSIPADKAEKIRADALAAITSDVYPALKKLRNFVITVYIPQARETIAWSDMPNGEAWYLFRVKQETTTSMSPDQLHLLGLSEVARIKAEMEKIKDQVKFKGDLKAFNQFLLTDKRFYYSTKEELLEGYRDIGKRIDPELPKLFKTLPRLTYGVRAMADHQAAEAPAAYYNGGSLEAGRPGYFDANTYDLKSRPKWGMEALTLHEAVPGHHLQISLAQEIPGLPKMRTNNHHTAFVEGWGLYAESLGEDIGLFKDPYSKYGQLTFEMWRSVRLVVDTGIHSKGWTRDQAIDYFMSAMPKSRGEAEVEVDRYITWPGQALAYKVGELKFKELKARAKRELGDDFDIRIFHDELLKHGSLPLDVLEKGIEAWIQNQRKIHSTKS